MYIDFVHILEGLPTHRVNIKCGPAVEDALHLLETLSLRFLDEEENKNRHDNIKYGIECENIAAPRIHHVARDQGEEEVEQPLC